MLPPLIFGVPPRLRGAALAGRRVFRGAVPEWGEPRPAAPLLPAAPQLRRHPTDGGRLSGTRNDSAARDGGGEPRRMGGWGGEGAQWGPIGVPLKSYWNPIEFH